MKHVYLSIDDMTDGFTIVDGKVKISDNYLSVAQSDGRYQPIGTYATKDEVLDTNDRIDLLSDVYQPLGNYVTTEFADENYITDADMQLYVVRTELENYATKQYVDDALSGFDGGSGGGTGGGSFNGTYTGNSTFTGDMTITGELTVPLIYDTVGTRQIQIADIVTTSELNDLLPGLGGGELPIATSEILGGVKIGDGIQVDAEGVISVTQSGGGSDYVLPVATKTTLGGVIAGDNVDIDPTGKISVTFPEQSGGGGNYTLPTASVDTLGGVKVGAGLAIDVDGVLSSAASQYVLPDATTTTKGGVQVGSGLEISDGVISLAPINSLTGEVVLTGKLVVRGDIEYSGELIQTQPGLDYKENTVKALFEHGRMIVGTPKTTGDIIYNQDGTFTDDDGGYSGKLTEEGYLDLSVENKIKTSIENCNLSRVNCFAYVEIIGKIGSANSIFAPVVRTDKNAGVGANTFLGTKNASSSASVGALMTDGLNRIVFQPTSSGNGNIFLNGVKLTGEYMLARATGSTDTDLYMAYCWAVGGTGLLKKCALIDYSGYGFNGDEDGILISKEGFKDSPAPVLKSLRNESELYTLKRRVDELQALVEGIVGGASGNAQTKPVAKFKRR